MFFRYKINYPSAEFPMFCQVFYVSSVYLPVRESPGYFPDAVGIVLCEQVCYLTPSPQDSGVERCRRTLNLL